jgi:hypothetical protein
MGLRALARILSLVLYGGVYVGLLAFSVPVIADAPNEYQVKAVFIFNFSHFVEWPPEAFDAPDEPFVIGVLGTDPFGARMDEAVKDEAIGTHPIVVRRFHHADDLGKCQILFIDRSEESQLGRVLALLAHHSTLTVSDINGAAERGVMIQFATDNNRVRLRINDGVARAAGLTISSKLLRPAEIVGTSLRE